MINLYNKSIYFIYLFLAVCFLNITEVNSQIIEWDKNYKLTWSDFKKEIKSNNKNAVSDIGISYNSKSASSKKIYFTVICTFNKKKSWAKEGSSTYLLKHEQGHFDIGELYARKIRKTILSCNKNLSREEFLDNVDKLYDELLNEYYSIQDKYDKETNHSMNQENQKEWNKRIDKQLKELEEYKNPKVVIKLKQK